MAVFLPTMTAVLAANLLTLLFVWGIYHASRRAESELTLGHFGALLVPPAMVGIGAFLFT